MLCVESEVKFCSLAHSVYMFLFVAIVCFSRDIYIVGDIMYSWEFFCHLLHKLQYCEYYEMFW